jgi:hypothetical protein
MVELKAAELPGGIKTVPLAVIGVCVLFKDVVKYGYPLVEFIMATLFIRSQYRHKVEKENRQKSR